MLWLQTVRVFARNVIKAHVSDSHLLYGQLGIIGRFKKKKNVISINMMHRAIIWLTRFFSVRQPSHPKAFRFNEYCIMSQAIMMRNVLGVCSGSLITGFVSLIQTASASLFTNWLKWMKLHRNKNSFDATQKWNQVCVSVFCLITVKWMTCKGGDFWCSVGKQNGAV